LELFHAACPAVVAFPLRVLFLSAFQRFYFWQIPVFIPDPARATRTVLIRSSNQSLFGNCDSFKLETCLNYLTRLGTVSHRPSPPIPHSHLARANAPEESVNFASADQSFDWLKRSRANQPNPTFPRLPGQYLAFDVSLPPPDYNLSCSPKQLDSGSKERYH